MLSLGNNTAHWNGRVTDLKVSTHMDLAGEKKDTMKVRKRGEKNLSFSKRAWFPLQYQESVTAELWGRYSGECFSVAL